MPGELSCWHWLHNNALNNINVICENGQFCLKYVLSKIITNRHIEVRHVLETRWKGQKILPKCENRQGNSLFLTVPATYVIMAVQLHLLLQL